MQAVRILLRQTSANYRKEESMQNKMTYPLPPVSTVIGAIHEACGYTTYHEMDISIQGKYGAMHREPYTDYCFQNSTMDDRGILVKMKNGALISKAYDMVASAKNKKNSSFREEKTIQVYNRKLLQEYQQLKELADEIRVFKNGKLKNFLNCVKKRKAILAKKKKLSVKGTDRFKRIVNREQEVKELEKKVKSKVKQYELMHYKKPISRFRSLVTSLKYYEVLNEVELLLHIRSDEETLNEILKHVYDIKSIGRSEDFVTVMDAQRVQLSQKEDFVTRNPYAAYIGLDEIRADNIMTRDSNDTGAICGTRYYLNKNYDTELAKTGQRIFHKVPVLYVSGHSLEAISDNLYMDKVNGVSCIVNFL